MRFALALGLSLWGLGSSQPLTAQDEKPFERQTEGYREVREGALAEAARAQSICASQLAEGEERGWWTKEEARTENERLIGIFEAPSTYGGRRPDGSPTPPSFYERVARATKPFDETARTAPLARWLATRLRALSYLVKDADVSFCRAAIEEAETIWLAAKVEADLLPARKILGEARSVLAGRVESAARRSRMPQIVPSVPPGLRAPITGEQEAAELADLISVIDSSEPLLWREPSLDPEGFAGMRVIWAALRRFSHRTIHRPRVAARYNELDGAFNASSREADRDLNAAILRDVPPAELENLLKKATAFRTPRLPASLPVSPQGIDPWRTQIDYLPWIEQRLRELRPRPGDSFSYYDPDVGGPRPVPACYQTWLRWRRAEAERRPEVMAELRKTLLETLAQFPIEVAEHVVARLARPVLMGEPIADIANGLPAGRTAADGLIAALQAADTTGRSAGGESQNSELIEAWRGVQNSHWVPLNAESQPFAARWIAIAAEPASRPIVSFRDNAAREILIGLLGPAMPKDAAATPVSTVIREQTERACALDDLELAGRLLALDRAGAFLFTEEHVAYAREIALLRQARDETRARRLSQARSNFHRLLGSTSSPAIAASAARALKSLPREVDAVVGPR